MINEQNTAEPKIDRRLIDAAQAIADMDASSMGDKEFFDNVLAIIARHAPPCPRCQQLDEFIAHRDFIHVAELKAVIDR